MKESLRKLAFLLNRRERWQLLFLFALMVLGATLEMIGVGAIPVFVSLLSNPDAVMEHEAVRALNDYLGVTSPRQLVLLAAAGLAILFVAKNSYFALFAYLGARYTYNRQVKIASRLFQAYMYSPYTFHLQRNTAELLRNMNQEVPRAIGEVLMPAMGLVMEMLVLAAIFSLLITVEPLVSFVALVTLGTTSALFYMAVRQKVSVYGQQQQHYSRMILQSIHQGLGGIKIAKVLGRERFFTDAFSRHAKGYAQAIRFKAIISQMPRLFIEIIGILGLLGIASVFILQGRSMASIVPTLALLTVAVARLLPSFNRITMALTGLRYGRYALDVVYDDLRMLERESMAEENAPLQRFFFHASIELDDLSYRYPDASETALKGISMKIPQGSAVAFVGPSGAGKTTVVSLILGLLEPVGGAIRVDGLDIRENLRAWQRQIGYIPQEIYLSDDTIRRNIAFGLPDSEIVDENIAAAVTSAQLQGLIDSLPNGLDTVTGERGIRLSGGQRQRIGIARALYHHPQVLVMDEATSHLDNETERYIMEAIERLRGARTLIIIAHRLSTVHQCDRLFFLKGGQLDAEGTYPELLRTSRGFRNMAAV